MSQRGRSLNPGYKSGSHLSNCYRCGFTFRAEELRKTWDGLWVCEDDWESRHPQDFLRTKEERVAAGAPLLHDDTSQLAAAATFGQAYAVAGFAEAGRAVVGTDDDIPNGTFQGSGL